MRVIRCWYVALIAVAPVTRVHPHLKPYRAQGAAIAIEDAAVLGALLSYVSSLSQVPELLHAYEELRCVFTAPTTITSPIRSLISEQAAARDSDARDLPPEPEDFPPTRRARATRTRRRNARCDGGGARGQVGPGREPEPVCGQDEDPDSVRL